MTLLSYAFSTYPQPLQSGAAGRIDLGVFNPNAAYCSQIQVAVPIGTDATCLSTTSPAASVNTAKWTIADVVIIDGTDLGLASGSYASYTFSCRDASDYQIDYSLVLSLSATVDTPNGDFVYGVRELSGTSPSSLQPSTASWTLTKSTPVFFLDSLVTTTPAAPTVPATEFGNGDPVRFVWDSNGTWFQLFEKGSATPVYAGPQATYTLPNGVATDTTFVLAASVTGNPANDSPSGPYETIYLYDAVTVTVTNPDLTPRSVTASGAITAGTALNGASLAVSGPAATGALTVTGDAGVTGTVTAGGVTTSGTVSAGGVTTSGTVTAGAVTTSGTVTAGTASVGRVLFSDQSSLAPLPGNPGFLTIFNGHLYVANAGNANAFQAFNASGIYPVGWGQNNTPRAGNVATGLVGWVAQSSDFGLWTNGRVCSQSGEGMLTHLPAGDGHRVVTTPLSPVAEVYVTGTGTVSGGLGRVDLDDDTAAILHTAGEPYRVFLTPTTPCGGLAVTEKAGGHFVVSEAGVDGPDVTFDWLLVSRVPAEGGGAVELPERLPEARMPELPPLDSPAA